VSELSRGFVIDASVFVADARPDEPGHTDSTTFLRAVLDRDAATHLPAIVLAEIASAITRAIGDPWLAQRMASVYRRWPRTRIVAVDDQLGARAARLAAEQRLRGCDAVYVALAQTLGAPLVTLDQEQRDRAPSSVIALTPGEAAEGLRL
jgi:predicted nucleic acid-binding protein